MCIMHTCYFPSNGIKERLSFLEGSFCVPATAFHFLYHSGDVVQIDQEPTSWYYPFYFLCEQELADTLYALYSSNLLAVVSHISS